MDKDGADSKVEEVGDKGCIDVIDDSDDERSFFMGFAGGLLRTARFDRQSRKWLMDSFLIDSASRMIRSNCLMLLAILSPV
jgi:hypothetical protein